MRALVWFRSDLRTRDHPALFEACRKADRGVLAVFTVCPAQWQAYDWGEAKVGFLLRNLRALSAELERTRIPLRILERQTFAGVPEALLTLARAQDCDALFFNREYEVNEARRDEAVSRRFEAAGLAVRAFHDPCILEPGSVEKKTGGFYTVYTPFKRAWMAVLQERGGVELLGGPKRQPALLCAPDPVPESVQGFALRPDLEDLWPAGQAAAQKRLARYLGEDVSSYKTLRDFPAADRTSRLSPYLALGVLSARQCLDAALDAGGGERAFGESGLGTWIGQLVWREFYRHILVGFPRVSKNRAFQAQTERVRWRDDVKGFAAWCEGRTGVPLVDAAMRQLARTGWMHNRLRMVAAMYLTKDLLVDWRWGERFFMQQLVDGDLANNNGGWQWSASTGTDAAPYFRIFNPVAQSRKFDPDAAFLRQYLPELANLDNRAIHEPSADQRKACGYPEPIVDHAAARERAIAAFRDIAKGPQQPQGPQERG